MSITKKKKQKPISRIGPFAITAGGPDGSEYVTYNCQPGQIRGADGRCGPGIGISIPRHEMPQIKEQDLDAFIEWCKNRDVEVTKETVKPTDLNPTQKEFRQERVDSIPESKLTQPCLISEDNYVLDGTHRWIKHWQKGKDSDVPVLRINLLLRPALLLMKSFPKATFVTNAKNNKNPLRIDPTRTITLRRSFTQRIRKQWAKLKGRLVKLIIVDDAFGLGKRQLTKNEQQFKFTEGKVKLDSGQWISVIYVNKLTDNKYIHNSSKLDADELTDVAIEELRDLHEQGLIDYDVNGHRGDIKEVIEEYLRTFITTNENPNHDEHGRFSSDGNSSTSDSKVGSSKLVRLGKKLTTALVNKFKKFKDRYGTAGSIAICAAMITPLPGIGFATIGAAEGIRAINHYFNKSTHNILFNAGDYEFLSTDEQIQAFQRWLETQIGELIDGASEEALWNEYIRRGYEKGQGRAWDDTKGKLKSLATDKEKLDFYAGTREQFLKSAFGQAVSIERVKVLAGRTFDDLENVTHDMSTRMSRTLTDGLVQGKNPRDVARDLDDDLDIGLVRANTIAQTELIRAHAEGQLDAFENLGLDELGVAVEWNTADDNIVCPICDAMENVVVSIDEARGMIPAHPNCRCAFIPANVGENDKSQVRTQKEIDKSIDEANDLGADIDVDISKVRPTSILNTHIGCNHENDYLTKFSDLLVNMNPNHDNKGLFSSGGGNGITVYTPKEGMSIKQMKGSIDKFGVPDSDVESSPSSSESDKANLKEMWKNYKAISDPKVKDAIDSALWNADIDIESKKAPKEVDDEAKLVRQLSTAHRSLSQKGLPQDKLEQAEKVLHSFGMKKVDNPNDIVSMDHEKHATKSGDAFQGDRVKVLHSGWEKELKNGIMYQPMKSDVERIS